MPDALHGLHVVVTRPSHQAQNFVRLLQAAGATPILYPTMAIAPPADPVAMQAGLAQLAEYDAVIFISANAVEHAWAALSAGQRQSLRRKVVGAIGAATARTLQHYGITVAWQPTGGYTSEDFLALPAVQAVAGMRILVVRGQGGREQLAAALRQRGAHVDYVEVYRRVPPPLPTISLQDQYEKGELDIIAITSQEGLANLRNLLQDPPWLKRLPLLVGSQRLAAMARQDGFTTVVLAADPSDEAMLQALLAWAKESNA